MKLKIVTPLILLSSVSSLADVNMRDASFLKTFQDFSHPVFSRTYSSRSVWRGVFGFGWCATFEKTLKIRTPKDAELKECDRTRRVSIERQKDTWAVKLKNSTTALFNLKGQLIEFKTNKTSVAQVAYHFDGTVERIETPSKIYRFQYDLKTRNLIRIQANSTNYVSYEIENDNLLQVRNTKRRLQTYAYDSSHNLTEIKSVSGLEKIEYNAESDEVSTYQNSQGCQEKFQFHRISDLEYKSEITRKCPTTRLFGQTFSFKSQRTPQGTLVLTEIRTSGGPLEKSSLP